MIKKQFTLYLKNEPGALARVADILARRAVNIEGISVGAGVEVALVQIIVSNAAKAQQALKRANVPFTVQRVAVLELQNQPGALARSAARLASAGVNLNYIYGTANGERCSVVVSAAELAKVEALWNG